MCLFTDLPSTGLDIFISAAELVQENNDVRQIRTLSGVLRSGQDSNVLQLSRTVYVLIQRFSIRI